MNHLYQVFDANKFMLGIFIDLGKAFDLIDHKVLTKELERRFGIYLLNSNQLLHFMTNKQISKRIILGFFKDQFGTFIISNFCQ